jgi:hypothetical protein
MVLHFLNAQKKLTAHYNWLETCLSETYMKANIPMPLPSLDVIVKAGVHVIPEKGHLGYCPEPGVVYITVDPANPAFVLMPINHWNECLLMNSTMQQDGVVRDMAFLWVKFLSPRD